MGAPTLGFHNVSKTNNQDINGVLAGTAWNAGAGQATQTITYSFPTSSAPYGTAVGFGPGQYPNPFPFQGMGNTPLTAAQVTDVQRAFALISSYTGLTFTQVTEGPESRGTIRLANSSPTVVPTAVAQLPGSAVYSGDVFFGGTGRNPELGNFDSASAVLHEIGHALGLKHGEDNTQPFGALPSSKLDKEFSVMNYSDYIGQNLATTPFSTTGPGSSPQTYMMSDIAPAATLWRQLQHAGKECHIQVGRQFRPGIHQWRRSGRSLSRHPQVPAKSS